MNIFILDKDRMKCAEYATDTHVSSQIKELCQMLSTAHHVMAAANPLIKDINRLLHPALCKPINPNHPCTKWVRETTSNYLWAIDFLRLLELEFEYRKGKTHETFQNRYDAVRRMPKNIPEGPRTPFARCIPKKYTEENIVDAYRRYYNEEKSRLFEWTNREVPYWII